MTKLLINFIGVLVGAVIIHVITVVTDIHLFDFLDGRYRQNQVEMLNSPECTDEVINTKVTAAEKFGEVALSYDTWQKRFDGSTAMEWHIRFKRKEDPKVEFVMMHMPSACEAVDKMYRRVTSYGLEPVAEN